MPFEELSLDEDVRELFKSVLKKTSSERPTALELLKHQRICDGKIGMIMMLCCVFDKL